MERVTLWSPSETGFRTKMRKGSVFNQHLSLSHDRVYTAVIESPNEKNREMKESPYLVIFLNMHSYLLIFPFKIKYSNETNIYFATTSRIRKTICMLFQFFVVSCLSLIMYPLLRDFVFGKRTVTYVFSVVSQLSIVTGTFLVIKVAWFDVEKIVELCNMTSVPKVEDKKSSRKILLAKILTCGTCFLVMGVHVCQGLFSMTRILEAMKAYEAVKSIFSPIFEGIGFNPFSWIVDVFGSDALQTIGLALFSMFCTFSNLPLTTFLALSICMDHCVTRGLLEFVTDKWKHNAPQIVMEYDRFKDTTSHLKETFSAMIICHYVMTLSYFTRLPKMFVVVKANHFDNIFVYGFLTIVSVSLYLAMRASVKAEDCMREFIHSRHQLLGDDLSGGSVDVTEERLQLIALSQDVDTSHVGVSSSFFTITKSFIRSTIGIIATYVIIVLQMSG